MTLRSIGLAILVAAIWGGNFVAVKYGTQSFPPLFLLTLRFFFVALLILPFARPLSRSQLGPIVAIALTLGVFHFGLMFIGVDRINASTAAIGGQLGVPFSTLLAVLLFGETLGWRRIAGILVAFAGVIVLAGAPTIADDLLGLGLIVLAAFAWAVANTIIKQFGPFDTFTLTAWMAVFAVPLLLAASLALEEGQWESLSTASMASWLGVVYMVVPSSIVAYAVWYSLLNRNDVSQVVPFTLLAPVFATVAAALMLGEAMTLALVAGGLLTIAGVALCEIRFNRLRMLLK